MSLLAIIGIALEIVGFFFVIRSTKRLDYSPGGFIGPEYKDLKTGKPPPHIESYPNPLLYRPGIIVVMIGLGLQILDIVIPKIFPQIEEI
jgi:hypothetical protein